MLQIVLKVITNFRASYIVAAVWLICICQNSYWKDNDIAKKAPWENREIINNDIILYYEYLPAFFIFQDPSFNFYDKVYGTEDFTGQMWISETDSGGKYVKMTMGLSFLYTPFFFAAHLCAKLFGWNADGYSTPYLFFLSFSGMFYAFLGLLLLEEILKSLYSIWVARVVVITIGLATNLYFYSVYDGLLSHAHNFFLISLFIFFYAEMA